MTKKKSIHNRAQLRQRLEDLHETIDEQETVINKNFDELKNSLSPKNILINSVSSITGIRVDKNEFLREGVITGIGLLLQRAVVNSESNLEKKVYHTVDRLFKKAESFIQRFTTRSKSGLDRMEGEE
jgi:hypothetical protein